MSRIARAFVEIGGVRAAVRPAGAAPELIPHGYLASLPPALRPRVLDRAVASYGPFEFDWLSEVKGWMSRPGGVALPSAKGVRTIVGAPGGDMLARSAAGWGMRSA